MKLPVFLIVGAFAGTGLGAETKLVRIFSKNKKKSLMTAITGEIER